MYTLIILIFVGASGITTITSDFTSKITCESARDIFVDNAVKNVGSGRDQFRIVSYGCYKK